MCVALVNCSVSSAFNFSNSLMCASLVMLDNEAFCSQVFVSFSATIWASVTCCGDDDGSSTLC